MKISIIAFVLLFISSPVIADPAPRCPCYNDMQVAGMCAQSERVSYYEDDTVVQYGVGCFTGDDGVRTRYIEFGLDYNPFNEEYFCRFYVQGEVIINFIRTEQFFSPAEADACVSDLLAAACLLDDANC